MEVKAKHSSHHSGRATRITMKSNSYDQKSEIKRWGSSRKLYPEGALFPAFQMAEVKALTLEFAAPRPIPKSPSSIAQVPPEQQKEEISRDTGQALSSAVTVP